MGDVYLATRGRKRVAIKLMKPSLAAHPQMIQRFFQEAQAASRVRHPGIVEILAFGEEAGQSFIAMELLDGLDFEAFLAIRLPTLDELTTIASQVARALTAAHAAKIVHRDLKPENIFIARDHEGRVSARVLDFGIAKAAWVAVTQPGQFMGSPAYMAPEQARGAEKADEYSDVYALGCILYHATCGQLPFTQADVPAVLHAHSEQTVLAPQNFNSSLPQEIANLIVACLQKLPSGRPAMNEVAKVLERYAPLHPVMHPFPRTDSASRRRAVAIGAAVLVAAVGAGVIGFGRGDRARPSIPHVSDTKEAASIAPHSVDSDAARLESPRDAAVGTTADAALGTTADATVAATADAAVANTPDAEALSRGETRSPPPPRRPQPQPAPPVPDRKNGGIIRDTDGE